MKHYERPVVVENDSLAEGIYLASGDTAEDENKKKEKVVCRFGRTEASAGSDTCQSCNKTNGSSGSDQAFRNDFKNFCPDNMPFKE